MYIETSLPRRRGDKAYFISPRYDAAPNGKCFKFWYHMYGRHIGKLNIYVKAGPALGAMVWNETGNQGNFWLHGKAPVKISTRFQVGNQRD